MISYEKYSFLLLTGLFGCACDSDIIPVTTLTKENLVAQIVSEFALKFIHNDSTFISMMTAESTREQNLLHRDIITNIITLNNAKFTYRIVNYRIHLARRHSFHVFLIESYKDFV